MSGARLEQDQRPSNAFSGAAKTARAKQRTPSPVTLRLTAEERAKLEELAAGMTLSAYIRGCLFAKETKRRKRRPKNTVTDKRAAAEALALLGQSRIASNCGSACKIDPLVGVIGAQK